MIIFVFSSLAMSCVDLLLPADMNGVGFQT